MAKRKRYTDQDRASAVLMYEANPNFVRVAKHLRMPEATLRSWVNRKQELDKNPQGADLDVEVYDKNKIDFVGLINAEMLAIFKEMKGKRDTAEYKELGIVFAILQDKKQLLTGGPTENINQQHVLKWANA